MPKPDLGSVLREWRTGLGLTLEQLGEKCGLTASGISRYERNERPLTLEVIEKVMVGVGSNEAADALLASYLRARFPRTPLFAEG